MKILLEIGFPVKILLRTGFPMKFLLQTSFVRITCCPLHVFGALKKNGFWRILDLYRIEFILGDANWFLRQILVLYRISATRFCFVSSDISYHLHKYFICILEKKYIYIYIYMYIHISTNTFWLYIDICNGNIYYVCFLLADAPRFHVEKYLFINI